MYAMLTFVLGVIFGVVFGWVVASFVLLICRDAKLDDQARRRANEKDLLLDSNPISELNPQETVTAETVDRQIVTAQRNAEMRQKNWDRLVSGARHLAQFKAVSQKQAVLLILHDLPDGCEATEESVATLIYSEDDIFSRFPNVLLVGDVTEIDERKLPQNSAKWPDGQCVSAYANPDIAADIIKNRARQSVNAQKAETAVIDELYLELKPVILEKFVPQRLAEFTEEAKKQGVDVQVIIDKFVDDAVNQAIVDEKQRWHDEFISTPMTTKTTEPTGVLNRFLLGWPVAQKVEDSDVAQKPT